MIKQTTADILRHRRGLGTPPPPDENQPRLIRVPVENGFNSNPNAAPNVDPNAMPFDDGMEAELSAAVDAHLSKNAAQGAPPMAEAPMEDTRDVAEMAAAQEADRETGLAQGMELAGRQLVGGITNTAVSAGLNRGPLRVPQAVDAAKSRRQRVVDALEAKRRGTMDESTLALQGSQTEKNERAGLEKPDGGLTKYQEAMLASRGVDQQARHKETDRKIAALEERSRSAGSILASKRAEAQKKEGLAAEGLKIPFGDGMFTPRAGVSIEKQIAKEASDKASSFGAAISGIDDFSKSLEEYAKHPSPEARDAVVAKANGVGGALNVAQGQGAMSEGEKKEMASALGVDVLSAAGIQAFAESLLGDSKGAAAATITRRAKAVRSSMIEMAKGNLKSKNYEYTPGAGANGGPKSGDGPGPGYVRGKTKSGASGWYNAATKDFKAD